jgi:tetratricopeptide (TPR) repeat protein
MKPSKRPSSPSKRPSPPLPLRGGVLSQLASAFRVRQAIVERGHAGVSKGSAKAALGDARSVEPFQHVAMLRCAVDQLFTLDYLEARGLDARAATEHNDLVTQAIESTLSVWDRFATLANAVPGASEAHDLLGLMTGLYAELGVRLAAYEARYGYLHPFLADTPGWLKGPKLAPWWKGLEERANGSIEVSTLYERGRLDSHTLRKLRDGESLPNDSTIPELARGLARHKKRKVRAWREDRDATAAELEVELRFAVAVAESRSWVERLVAPASDDALMRVVDSVRAVLRSAPDAIAEQLLREGTEARAWAAVRAHCEVAWVDELVETLRRTAADAERMAEAAQLDPKGAYRHHAEVDRQEAAALRALDPRPGADGPEKRLAGWFDHRAELAWALATDGPCPSPARYDALSATMKADRLCEEAVAPWSGLSPSEREHRLREAVRVDPSSAYATRLLGNHCHRMGNDDEAIEHLRRAVELNPENVEGLEALVLLLSRRGDHGEVLERTAANARTPFLEACRAYGLLRNGDVDRSTKLAEKVRQEHPKFALGLRVLAECRRAQGEGKDARELDQRAELFERGVRSPGA